MSLITAPRGGRIENAFGEDTGHPPSPLRFVMRSRRPQRTEHKARSRKHGMRSTKHGAQSTEHGDWNKKHGARSTNAQAASGPKLARLYSNSIFELNSNSSIRRLYSICAPRNRGRVRFGNTALLSVWSGLWVLV